jgi:pimeloyl-ACP methyl ester carboxylesterase
LYVQPVSDLREFRIDVPDRDVADLRRRLRETRWPERETVADWSQGLPLRVVQELCQEWEGHDWAATQARLNRIPQFMVTLEGLPVHLIHMRSPRPDAIPLVLTHGWPGSFLEFEQVLEPLTHGTPAFHVTVPSLPGYGFSGKPAWRSWNIHRIAGAWCELMTLLGYPRFIAAGSDWGTSISTSIALHHPDRLLGLHLVPPLVAPGPGPYTEAEQLALNELAERTNTASAYSTVHATRPQTIGYGLSDSPVMLAAWIGEKLLTWSDASTALSRQQVLEGLSLYWFTRTGASSARLYAESIAEVSAWFTDEARWQIDAPTGATVFPREVPRSSRRWAERRFTHLVHWGEPAHGGHFGAWEQPTVFVDELRATARSIPPTHPER